MSNFLTSHLFDLISGAQTPEKGFWDKEKVNTPVTAVNQQCLTCQRMTDGHLFFIFLNED